MSNNNPWFAPWGATKPAIKPNGGGDPSVPQPIIQPLPPSTPQPSPPSTPQPTPEPNATPMAATGLQKQSADLYGKAGNVIDNQMTGNAYAPMMMQTQQALGRAEANQRAKAANAIHSAGFSGTPLGAAAGNATEAELLRNRFDTNLGVEVERQKLMNTGANNAMQYGDAVNRFEAGQMTNYATQRDMTTKDVLGNYAMWDGYDKAEDKDTYVQQYLNSNPELYNRLTTINGGKPPTATEARNIMENMRKEADAGYQMRVGIKQLYPNLTDEELDAIMETPLETLGFKYENGKLVKIDTTTDDKVAEYSGDFSKFVSTVKVPEGDSASDSASDSVAYQKANDPVYQKIAKSTPPVSMNTELRDGSVVIPALEDKVGTGQPVKVDGTLYVVTGKSNSGASGNRAGTTTYTLYDPVSGNTTTTNTNSRSIDPNKDWSHARDTVPTVLNPISGLVSLVRNAW